MASKEANKLKYQYNKKYVEAYWERKAKKANGEVTMETSKKKINETSIQCDDSEIDVEDRPVTVPRQNKTLERYVKCLETANRTLSSENARLVRKVMEYQNMFKQISVLCDGY